MRYFKYSIVLLLAMAFIPAGCAPRLQTVPAPDTSADSSAGAPVESSTGILSLPEYLQQASWDQGATFEFPELDSFVMENGLRVFVVERHDLPMVYARAQIRGGSIYDPPGKAGLAYLTGWVLTEGTKSYPDQQIDTVMDRHGAYVSSVAYNESCIATLTCLSEDTGVLFPYFAEILSSSAFEESNLDEGRQYIIGDLMRMNDDAGELSYRRFRKDVFGDHPYAKPHKGTIQGLAACTRDDVLAFYRQFYRPDQAVLVLVGDITTGEVKSLCSRHLGNWKATTEPLPEIPDPEPVKGIKIRVVDKDTVQAQINIGHIGINRTDPDRFKLMTLNTILGGSGLYDRLSTEVRVKRGLTYGIYSFFARREFTGEFAVSTFTKISTLGEAVEVILNELKKIREEPVTEAELQDAKQSLIGTFPLQFEQYEGISQTLVHNNFYNLPMEDTTRFPQYINAITREDLLEAAQRHIHPDNIVITVVGPADQAVSQLEKFGEVEIVEPV